MLLIVQDRDIMGNYVNGDNYNRLAWVGVLHTVRPGRVAGGSHDFRYRQLNEKGVELLEEGELIEFSDLIKIKVFDGEGVNIGHLQDLAMDDDLESPYLSLLGVHLHWMDRVGEVELCRPVEDIVLLLPWSQVAGLGENDIHLEGVHPDFPVESARGKILLRRDVLNKQMLDAEGNRIQRVDDVLIEREGKTLKVAGLKVATGWFSSGPAVQGMLEKLRAVHGSRHDVEMIPWEAVRRVDDSGIVIGVSPGCKPREARITGLEREKGRGYPRPFLCRVSASSCRARRLPA